MTNPFYWLPSNLPLVCYQIILSFVNPKPRRTQKKTSFCELFNNRLTKLKLVNPSSLNHYFTALEFAEKVYTVLVLVGDPEVEVKGNIQEVELDAGASLTWILVPIKPGSYPLKCTVKGEFGFGPD